MPIVCSGLAVAEAVRVLEVVMAGVVGGVAVAAVVVVAAVAAVVVVAAVGSVSRRTRAAK